MDLLQRKPPPPLDQRFVRPNTALDHLILQTMQSRPERGDWTAHQVVKATGARNTDVWRRLNLLAKRGLLHRRKVPDGPDRGPGSYTYSVTQPIEFGTTDES